MYNFFIDLVIWSFAIFGFIKFFDEFALDIVYYIANFIICISVFFKKLIAKFER